MHSHGRADRQNYINRDVNMPKSGPEICSTSLTTKNMQMIKEVVEQITGKLEKQIFHLTTVPATFKLMCSNNWNSK